MLGKYEALKFTEAEKLEAIAIAHGFAETFAKRPKMILLIISTLADYVKEVYGWRIMTETEVFDLVGEAKNLDPL